MSEVFLDSELQARDYRRIAKALDISGYSLAEFRSILEDEVAPAFASNLWSVAGEWAAWSENDVQTIMFQSLSRRRFRLLSWLKRVMRRRHIEQEWEKIAKFLEQG